MQMTGRQPSKAGADSKHQQGAWALGLLAAIAGLMMVAVMGCTGAAVSQAEQGGPTAEEEATPASTPEPAPVAAAPASQEAKFFCYVETLTADRPSIYGFMAPRGCAPSGVFKRGERMVWRFVVLDVATGKEVTSEEADSVVLKLPFLVEEKAIFKQRGDGRVPGAPWTWEVCWDVPLDYPVGTLDYTILIALKDGRQGEWKPPALVDPSRGIDSRPQIIGSINDA
ncbi:MAG: hypothetical protein HY683_00890 [Chloroflexi bacterium]|nr:hypothetical protein [Chloroflexota bacterium]